MVDKNVKHQAYRLLNQLGYDNVFMVTQPSGLETFVVPELGIPSIYIDGKILRFFPCSLKDAIGHPEKSILNLDLSSKKKHGSSAISSFRKRLVSNLYYNHTTMINVEYIRPLWVSSRFFVRNATRYPLLSVGEGKGASPMYYLGSEHADDYNYLRSQGLIINLYHVDHEGKHLSER